MPALPLSRRALAALALVFALPALAEDWPDTDWPRAQQPAGPALEAFERYAFGRRDDVRRKGIRTDAVVVIRDGRLVYERYAGPSRAETPHLTWSVSKSLLATLLSVAEGEGRFQLDDPVARYYPPFARHPEVTLRHLLNWSSGLDWREDYEFAPLKSSVVAMLYTRGRDDMAGFVAETPQARPPGRAFPLLQRRQQRAGGGPPRHARRGLCRGTPGARCSSRWASVRRYGSETPPARSSARRTST